ncbi:MAG: HindVP family restriction endonuclease [Nostoc sp. DedVER02]|uniref:HindVP family restriction endonuclease n=1 Tax=unclassified Nostoc TaxID=2593658 RepID=UPI002AD47616|nr:MULTISPECIES: HindVP family restriction endonuclease [unclassified Nostoc]MDZ7987958.1 HindVP family restriction endonuclease [Nostoc sp. DedVER02]MDZ8114882.1 HindVP family restriction endonuclease [Nostoc sp. DedVER01b]
MNQNTVQPGLFGLAKSNRDFSQPNSWGKNQFNNSFPASLACYMHSKGLQLVYLTLDKNLKIKHIKIDVTEIFGITPLSPNLFFAFESDYLPYRKLVIGRLLRVDLVTLNTLSIDTCLRSIEIKLTALPDNSTCRLPDHKYGCEIVTRPDTIVYLALSIADKFQDSREQILKYLEPVCSEIIDWISIPNMLPYISRLIESLDNLLYDHIEMQSPLVMQPVWKTVGKTSKLYQNCLDIFIWSDFGFTRLFFDVTKKLLIGAESIQRHARTVIWLAKMLYEFATNGKIPHASIIDILTYHTKNDKAFASSGLNTHPYMICDELIKPRIMKEEIGNIILGGGQTYLSPERRFDGIILSNPEIFDEDLKYI